VQEFGASERQACRTVELSRCAYRYQAKRPTDEPIVQELRQLAEKQPRWGCGKMTDYLRNEGHNWNHKRIRRVYRAMALHPLALARQGKCEAKTEKAVTCSSCTNPGSA